MKALRTIVLALVIAGPAGAGGGEAKRRFERGMKAYNLQKFDVALSEFQSAYEEHPDAAFLFNIAQCQRQLGQYEQAAKSYRVYLAQPPEAPNREDADSDSDAADLPVERSSAGLLHQ